LAEKLLLLKALELLVVEDARSALVGKVGHDGENERVPQPVPVR
jgi:hypothetical protein